jgi:hypothetical protein
MGGLKTLQISAQNVAVGWDLHPSEVVTLGMLFALKGVGTRAFYRWLSNNYRYLFPRLPERTRLFRRLNKMWELAIDFLKDPTVLGVVDTYGIELIHPYREGRSDKQIGRKGLSNHRWIVGAKMGIVVNQWGHVVAWSLMPANVHDTAFLPLVAAFEDEMIVLADSGFHGVQHPPPCNLKICKKGTWNDRMVIETIFSMKTLVMHAKRMSQRTWDGLIARLSYMIGAFNVLVTWNGVARDEDGFATIRLSDFSL